MKKKAKLKLENIEVESFITTLDDKSLNARIGGTTGGEVTYDIACSDDCSGAKTCPNTFEWDSCAYCTYENC